MAEINAGDTVQLKSGGPIMTVESLEKSDNVIRAWCQWFDGDKPMVNRFYLWSLRLASDGASRYGNLESAPR